MTDSNSKKDQIEKIQEGLLNQKEQEKKLQQFADVLENMDNLDSKLKILWTEIYDNAVHDRNSAGFLFLNLFSTMGNGIESHATIGGIIVRYLERMSKSNDQLLKLADMIKEVEDMESQVDVDELYEKMHIE